MVNWQNIIFKIFLKNYAENVHEKLVRYLDTIALLIQSSFRVIQKLVFANLCKTYHDVMIIPFVNFDFEIKTLEKNKENHKKKKKQEITKTKKDSFR